MINNTNNIFSIPTKTSLSKSINPTFNSPIKTNKTNNKDKLTILKKLPPSNNKIKKNLTTIPVMSKKSIAFHQGNHNTSNKNQSQFKNNNQIMKKRNSNKIKQMRNTKKKHIQKLKPFTQINNDKILKVNNKTKKNHKIEKKVNHYLHK
jgi:hypothetical protein